MITKNSNPYKVSATGSGWYLLKLNPITNEYEKFESFGNRTWGRIMALELMYKLNNWTIPVEGFK